MPAIVVAATDGISTVGAADSARLVDVLGTLVAVEDILKLESADSNVQFQNLQGKHLKNI